MKNVATLMLGSALLGACNEDGSYEEGFKDGLEQGQGGADNGNDSGSTDDEPSHTELCREILAKAEEALSEGYTAQVTVDADPNELASGYDNGVAWMTNAFDTDDGNGQVHVPCTSLRVDGDWEVAGELEWNQSGSDLDIYAEFDQEPFNQATMLDLNWVVMGEAGPRYATDPNGDVDFLYTIDHNSDVPVGGY